MLRVYRGLDVHRGQKGEDVGLEDGNDDLEGVDAESDDKPANADRDLGQTPLAREEHPAGDKQQGEHHVAGYQVGKEPDRQAEGPHQECRHQFDDAD